MPELPWSAEGIELPLQVSAALANGKLVIFCGAGISIPPPSSLPNYLGLAEHIKKQTGSVEPIDEKHLDVSMGQLDRAKGNVHRRTAELISSSAEPNPLHHNIVDIASSSTIRIVTTNFDNHLDRVATERAADAPIYTAPTLPRGDDFHGIVHLHGHVPIAPDERLIVTDQDFGRAYITEGWATEFLTAAFANYVVLFVGYSATDTVMRYLARSVPSTRNLYAITPDDEIAGWTDLDVIPLPYKKEGSSHARLERFLDQWRSNVLSTPADRADRIAAAIKAGPPTTESAAQELRWLLSQPDYVRYFIQDADPSEWLAWTDSQGLLDDVFVEPAEPTGTEALWSAWLASAVDRDCIDVLLQALGRHIGLISRELWSAVSSRIGDTYGHRANERPLLHILAASDSADADRLSYLFLVVAEEDPAAAEVLLGFLLRPHRSYGIGGGWSFDRDEVRVDITLGPDRYDMTEAWGLLRPRLTRAGYLLDIALSRLAQVDVETAFFSGQDDERTLSKGRRSIADADIGTRQGPTDFAIDVARDLLEDATRAMGPQRAIDLLASPSELIRRIAALSLRESHRSQADTVLQALVGANVILRSSFRREIAPTVRSLFGDASDEIRDAFIAHVTTVEPENEHSEIRPSSRLAALANADSPGSDYPKLKAAIGKLRDSTPVVERLGSSLDFVDLDYASFEPVPEPVPTGRYSGMTIAQVADLIETDRTLDDDWDSDVTLAEITAHVRDNPRRALDLLEQLSGDAFWARDVWRAILRTLGQRLPPTLLGPFEHVVLTHPELSELIGDLELVVNPVFEPVRGVSTRELRPYLDTALRIWSACASDERAQDQSDRPGGWVLESGKGKAARAVINMLVRVVNTKSRASFSKADVATVEKIAQSASPASVFWLGLVTNMIVDADRSLFEHSILPLFEADTASGNAIWEGQLIAEPMNPRVRAAVAPLYQVGLARTKRAMPHAIDPYITLNARLFASQTDPQWPDNFLTQASPGNRADWISAVAHESNDDSHSWPSMTLLLDHWDWRLQGLPDDLSGAEQLSLIEWVSLPGMPFAEAAERFAKGPVVEYDHGRGYYRLQELLPVTDEKDLGLARMYLRLITSAPNLPPQSALVVELAKRIADRDSDLALEILNELLQRGFGAARAAIRELAV